MRISLFLFNTINKNTPTGNLFNLLKTIDITKKWWYNNYRNSFPGVFVIFDFYFTNTFYKGIPSSVAAQMPPIMASGLVMFPSGYPPAHAGKK